MKNKLFYLSALLFPAVAATAQGGQPAATAMIFVSDTQQPMWIEKIRLKENHNLLATAKIFTEILNHRPKNLYMLGDVVSLGYSKKKWKKADIFLDSCRRLDINVSGILGNHEVLFCRKKGESNFEKRFPNHVRTGYLSVIDSVAIILLNSNFKSLSVTDRMKQQSWYESVIAALDTAESVRSVIVTCHHAPFSNSKIVGSSAIVQEYFVPAFIRSAKAQLFITGHSHAFEHFNKQGKDFVVTGGGGGLHQPLNNSTKELSDLAADYKPMFHYLCVWRIGNRLIATSHFLKADFSGFGTGYSFITHAVKNSHPVQ